MPALSTWAQEQQTPHVHTRFYTDAFVMHMLAASTMYYLSNAAFLKACLCTGGWEETTKKTMMNKSYCCCQVDQGSIRLPCATCAGVQRGCGWGRSLPSTQMFGHNCVLLLEKGRERKLCLIMAASQKGICDCPGCCRWV